MWKKAIIPFIIITLLYLSCEQKDTADRLNTEDIDILLTSISRNSLRYLEFTYDSINRLISSDLYHDDTAYSRTAYFYDSENRLTGKSYDGCIETYDYRSDGLPESITKTYPETNKVWKRIFQYEDGMITRAEIFYNNTQTDYAIYKYDSKANTTEIREYALNDTYPDFIMTHHKFKYDNALNPLNMIGYTAIDLTQINNPTYVYFENALMCSGPVEYDAAYDYDENGLPLKEYRTYKGHSDADEFTFDYQLIRK
jgi:hypothetical protein